MVAKDLTPEEKHRIYGGLVCPEHGRLMDTYRRDEIHKDGKVLWRKVVTYHCGCIIKEEEIL